MLRKLGYESTRRLRAAGCTAAIVAMTGRIRASAATRNWSRWRWHPSARRRRP
jgi:hypothetical protein